MKKALSDLDSECPTDETCEVSVGERQGDSWIHVRIVRRRKTLISNDGWSVALGDEPDTYKYEKTFKNSSLSVNDIVQSISRMLKAPESPDEE
jgi:hypothetical protein